MTYYGEGRNARTAGNTCGFNEHRGMRTELGEAYRVGFQKHCGHQAKALEEVGKLIERDRRFDAYDKDRLVQRFNQCRGTGGYLDFNDPSLRKGSPPAHRNWTAPPSRG
jgi:hypothetical protein